MRILARMQDESEGYDVPDTSDLPKFWADGPNKGKRVGTTSIKVRSLKLDPNESVLRAEAAELARLTDLGRLEVDKDHAQLEADLKKAAYELACSFKRHPWKRVTHVPPSRWPTYLLTAVLAALVMVQVVLFVQSQRPTPQTPEVLLQPPPAPERRVASLRKGRVER